MNRTQAMGVTIYRRLGFREYGAFSTYLWHPQFYGSSFVSSISEWPPELERHLEAHHGIPRLIEPLTAGQSRASVFRLHFASTSCILKRCSRDTECHFYTQVAPTLRMHGIGIPKLCWSLKAGVSCWLMLEDIPQPVPLERRLADPEMIAALRRLHTVPLQSIPDLAQYVRLRWTNDLADTLTARLPREVGQLLEDLQQRHQYLFQPTCLISGDPNPSNWAVRMDGKLVLFDWERFGAGTPALDLAITVPGLGDAAAYGRVAARYLEDQNVKAPSAAAIDALTHDIAVAKVWTVVEYLSEGTGRYADEVFRALPSWLEEIRAIEKRAGC